MNNNDEKEKIEAVRDQKKEKESKYITIRKYKKNKKNSLTIFSNMAFFGEALMFFFVRHNTPLFHVSFSP